MASFEYLVSLSCDPPTWEEQEKLFKKLSKIKGLKSFKLQEKEIVEKLCSYYYRLLLNITTKCHRNTHLSQEDILSEASVILLNCVYKYDVYSGYKFSTYLSNALFKTLQKPKGKEDKHHTGREGRVNGFENGSFYDNSNLLEIKDVLDSVLSQEEAYLVLSKFGIGETRQKTYVELGKELNISPRSLSSKTEEALKKLEIYFRNKL